MTTTTTTTGTAATGTTAQPQVGTESSLSNWAGPYVTEMLGRGQALASAPYQAYTGQLTAGPSALQQQAFQGIAGLALPTQQMSAFTPQTFGATQAQQYMSPYLTAALEPQIAEARRQAELQRMQEAGRLSQAGAFGGSRQAVMEAEGSRNLLRNIADITGRGYESAYQQAMQQFNTEEERRRAAQNEARQYGLGVLARQAELGGLQRGIEQEGIAADLGQFREERDYPYKQVQYMQSLLQGLPVAAQSYTYQEPSQLEQILKGAGGLQELYDRIFGTKKTPAPAPAPAPAP